jgi:hypothetical protein
VTPAPGADRVWVRLRFLDDALGSMWRIMERLFAENCERGIGLIAIRERAELPVEP